MQLASEYTVTKLITRNEILKNKKSMYMPLNTEYNLGQFLTLENCKPSPWGDKYLFVK